MKTNAMRILDKQKITYEVKSYEVDEKDLSATHIAETAGLDIDKVYKTLVARGDKTGVMMAVIGGGEELDLKKLAKASSNKSVEMIALKELLPLTGYVRGGCSPIGAKKNYPVYLDKLALQQEKISISAGQRGLQIILKPDDLIKVTKAMSADLIKNS